MFLSQLYSTTYLITSVITNVNIDKVPLTYVSDPSSINICSGSGRAQHPQINVTYVMELLLEQGYVGRSAEN